MNVSDHAALDLRVLRFSNPGASNVDYGEDPWLAAHLSKAEVQGIQAEGVIACSKHFILYTQEGPRNQDGTGCGGPCLNSIVEERVLPY